jgi:hypothetical protein
VGVVASRLVVCVAACFLACDTPHTEVIVDNAYAAASANVIYRAFWQSISFTTPIAPGESSDATPSVFATPNTAYVLLAPGWDPQSSVAPTSFVILESQVGFALDLNTTLHIPVSDATFTGNCKGGSELPQDEADFIAHRVFADTFAGLHYDAATCTTVADP